MDGMPRGSRREAREEMGEPYREEELLQAEQAAVCEGGVACSSGPRPFGPSFP